MNPHFVSFPSRILSRRELLQLAVPAAALAAGTGASRGAEATPRLTAAVIGHTGRGDYGHGLDEIFTNRNNIEIVALADPDPEGRRKTGQKIRAARSYADYREMLAKERPKLVSLAMRQADQHHAIALEVLRAGAHLYCEKPFTTTPAEADDLLAEARQRRLRIAVAHTMRMMPAVLRLKQAITAGIIGDLAEVRAYGKQDARAGGEDMMVLGAHLFDLLRLFLGDPVWCAARVLGNGRDITKADGHLVKDNVGLVAGDEIFAQFAFAQGINATFTSSARLRETIGHWGLEFYGSRGVVRINCDLSPNVFIRRSTAWTTDGKTDSWTPLEAVLLKLSPSHNSGPVGDWLEAIQQDREPECSGRNGAWAIEMVLAVYWAALGGKRVSFPLVDRRHPLVAG